ncbi:MAG: XdhC family protein [Polyangiaceae bacterium]
MSDAERIMPKTAAAPDVLREVVAWLDAGSAVAVATVISRQGSAPSTPGQKLAITVDGRAIGTIGGGAVERAVIRAMLEALESKEPVLPRVHTFRLGPNLGMCCGGSADVLLEIMRAGAAVLVVGGGHVGLATSRLLAELGFRTVLVDAREGVFDGDRGAEATRAGARLVQAEHDDPEVVAALGAPAAESALVVMTHDHQLDQAVIEHGLRAGFAFVGGVGSHAKAERTRQRLAAKDFSEADVTRVRMPLGVSVGARRPLEIAIAITAELVGWRAAREGLVRKSTRDDS